MRPLYCSLKYILKSAYLVTATFNKSTDLGPVTISYAHIRKVNLKFKPLKF